MNRCERELLSFLPHDCAHLCYDQDNRLKSGDKVQSQRYKYITGGEKVSAAVHVMSHVVEECDSPRMK